MPLTHIAPNGDALGSAVVITGGMEIAPGNPHGSKPATVFAGFARHRTGQLNEASLVLAALRDVEPQRAEFLLDLKGLDLGCAHVVGGVQN